ncbi:hypothetical protein SKA58_16943 [Sphingomonas sp. SKA58]|nr:hypothetical protein SKA58_16943 [Sphingomonas sp. SKA58]
MRQKENGFGCPTILWQFFLIASALIDYAPIF